MRIPFEMLSVIVAYISQIEQMFSGDSQINDDDRGYCYYHLLPEEDLSIKS